MVKINAAWFAKTERGRFAGIFGFMINLSRFGIFKLGPMLLGGFVFLGLILFHGPFGIIGGVLMILSMRKIKVAPPVPA